MLLRTFHSEGVEAGVDEAGRGCYAGPVYAAAVILPPHFHHPLLNDSKQVCAEERTLLRGVIEAGAIAWAVGSACQHEIDTLNILQATYLAMHRAIKQLSTAPSMLVIDGNRFKPYTGIAHCCVVKADGKYMHVAAASILAKTHRDEYMENVHAQHPAYGWNSNKGYGTPAHRAAIDQYGLTPLHRKSFNILNVQPTLAFAE